MVLPYQALWSYTLYFIFYSVYTLLSPPPPLSPFAFYVRASPPSFVLAFSPRCATRLHAERFSARFSESAYYAVGVPALLPTWPRLSRTPLALRSMLFHHFSPFPPVPGVPRFCQPSFLLLFLPFFLCRHSRSLSFHHPVS